MKTTNQRKNATHILRLFGEVPMDSKKHRKNIEETRETKTINIFRLLAYPLCSHDSWKSAFVFTGVFSLLRLPQRVSYHCLFFLVARARVLCFFIHWTFPNEVEHSWTYCLFGYLFNVSYFSVMAPPRPSEWKGYWLRERDIVRDDSIKRKLSYIDRMKRLKQTMGSWDWESQNKHEWK